MVGRSLLLICLALGRRDALTLQELCAQVCTAQFRSAGSSTPMSVWFLIVLLMSLRAPELFEVPSECVITAKSDIWSLGCSVFAAAFGEKCSLAALHRPSHLVSCDRK